MNHPDRKLIAFGLGMLACGAGLLLATGAILGHAATRMRGPEPAGSPDRCAAPAWASALPMSTRAADQLTRWAMLCADVEAGRIDRITYTVRWLDVMTPKVAIPAAVPPEPIWASRVVEFSSQYGDDDWAAKQVLGRPDVTGRETDPRAWAPADPDSANEHVTVALDTPVQVAAVELYETANPGQVTVELIDESGASIVAPPAGSSRAPRLFAVDCTEQKIAQIKVTVDSSTTPDWSELDAIGVIPCSE